MKQQSHFSSLPFYLISFCLISTVQAEETARPMGVSVNDLGTITITVTGKRPLLGEINSAQAASVLTQRDMQRFRSQTVAEALNLLSGVNFTTVGARNESAVSVRGFDMRQVPLFIDGIPAQVPYDGYVDFGRFVLNDLAAIQVSKGFSSDLYGANTLGGAINLVSRKPTQVFEGDISLGIGKQNTQSFATNLGTKRKHWYAQLGASTAESDGFTVSDDFQATATENGKLRENAYRKDNKLSLKLGYTPNKQSETVISYYQQQGEKGNPPSTNPKSARYWRWPHWDTAGSHLITKHVLTPHETITLRLYQDSYKNGIDSYTDATYTILKTSGSGSVGATGKSRYDDQLQGASVELESSRFKQNALRLSVQQRRDKHKSDDTKALIERFQDTTQSIAINDDIQLSPQLTLAVGAAHQQLQPDEVYKASDAIAKPGQQSATNAQGGLFWDFNDHSRVYASVANKSRLPTLKDRYSLRLGSAIPNPDLKAEKARHYEVGYQGQLNPRLKVEAALFHSHTDDLIQRVNNVQDSKYQMQNVGEVSTSGLEASTRLALAEQWQVGGQLTVMDRENKSSAAKLTGIPERKVALDVSYKPMPKLDTQVVVNHESSRWDSDTTELDGFTTADTKLTYQPTKHLSLEAGITNLTDKNYQLSDGFPMPGRLWYSQARYEF